MLGAVHQYHISMACSHQVDFGVGYLETASEGGRSQVCKVVIKS